MIEAICHIALIILLGISFYQDWKYRAISWMIFPMLLTVAAILFWQANIPVRVILVNCAFLTVVLGCLFLYISIKRGRLTNIFKADFGLGDVLFLIAITPLFVDRNYILFFISGMFLSALFHVLIASGKGSVKIPLAGYLAVYIIALDGVRFIWMNDLFYTPLL